MRHRPLVYLDTNVFVRGIEGVESEAAPILKLLERLRDYPGASVTSELTLAELLAPTGRANTLELHVKEPLYLDMIADGDFISLHPVTREILIQTAHLRVNFPQKLPDAIHIVTAVQTGCRFFMSHDRDSKRLPNSLLHVYPNENGVATTIEALRA